MATVSTMSLIIKHFIHSAAVSELLMLNFFSSTLQQHHLEAVADEN